MACIICISSLVFFFSSTTAIADIPLDVITGLVLDEYGQPVPNATVTLMQGGRLWQPNESVFSGITNPQTSGFEGDKVGWYDFSLLYPGQYTIMVEKWGYKGSASVQINDTNVHSPHSVNIILEDFDAALSQEQVSYRGGVAGQIWDTMHDLLVHYANVSICHDGQMVRISDNPQKSMDGNFSFRHLAPGRYEIKIEAPQPSGDIVCENATVDVGTGIVNNDIIMQHYASHHPSAPTRSPVSASPSPTPEPPTATPAPSTGAIMVLLCVCCTGVLICKSLINKK